MFILLLGSHKFGLDPRRIVESAALPGSLSSLLNGLFAVPLLLTNLSPREMPRLVSAPSLLAIANALPRRTLRDCLIQVTCEMANGQILLWASNL